MNTEFNYKNDLTAIQLSEKDNKELVMLANEPIENNTISLDEFKNIMDNWRMKMSSELG